MAAGFGQQQYKASELYDKYIEISMQNAKFRHVLEKIMKYRRGIDEYDFSRIDIQHRNNEAFDAWNKIEEEIVNLLNK